MNFWRGVVNAFKAATGGGKIGRIFAAANTAGRYAYTDLTRFGNQAKMYSNSPWVYIAASKIARTCALVPFSVFSYAAEDKTAITDHPLEQLLRRPNDFQSQFEFMEATIGFLQVNGNAYWYLDSEGRGGAPTQMLLLRPDRVKIAQGTGSERIKGYVYGVNAREIPLDPVEVIHFKRFNPTDDYYGLAPMASAALSVQADISMAEWNRNFFGRDQGIPAGVVGINTLISDLDYERIKAEWSSAYGGTTRKTAFIRGGDVTYSDIGTAHRDLDFTVGRQFEKELILQVYGVPPGMLDKNSTEANANAGIETFTRDTIWPQLVEIAQKLTTDLAPFYGDNLVVEAEDVRVRDRKAELQELQAAGPYLTVNEVRQRYWQLDELPTSDDPADKPAVGALAMPGGLPSFGKPQLDQTPMQIEQKDQQAEGKALPAGWKGLDDIDVVYTHVVAPRIVHTRPIRKELEQFARYAAKGKDVGAFEFIHAPLPLALAVKSLADIDQLDLLTYKATDNPTKYERRIKTALADYFDGLSARLVKGVRHVNAPSSGKALPDIKRFLSYFDDTFWDSELDELASVMTPLIQDAVNAGALDGADALHMTAGIGFDPAVFNPMAAKYALTYTDKVLAGFNTTTREGTGAILARYVADGNAGIDDLASALQESALFGGSRAALVAATEATRAFGMGEYLAGEELAGLAGVDVAVTQEELESVFPAHPGDRCNIVSAFQYDENNNIVSMDYIWNTVNAENVCVICEPRNGRLISEIIAEGL